MIKFFRQIRQQLLSQNKVSRYLLYAVGEIILVVIGILIALQINNWNEDRKLENQELSLLAEVKSNLEATLDNLKRDTLFNRTSIGELRKIEYFIREDLPYSDELDTAFGMFGTWQSPYPITTAYSTLKTKGLDLISNPGLRDEIAQMYEYEFVVLSNDYDKGEWAIIQNAGLFLLRNIRSKNSGYPAGPNDFEDLKRQAEFSNILSKIIGQREFGIQQYKAVMLSLEALIEQIENELMARNQG